jgi:hypothetical protein
MTAQSVVPWRHPTGEELNMRALLRITLALGTVALAMALAVPAAGAQTTYPLPTDGQDPTTSVGSLNPGECTIATQGGLTPGMTVTFVLTDSAGGTTSVTATADANGVATAQVCVAANGAAGPATISVTDGGTAVLGEVVVNVGGAQDTDDSLAFTGRNIGSTLAVAALAVVVGTALVGLARRREGVSS